MTKQRIPGRNREAILAGWKNIADYLRVSIRTAQNWENDQGLPIWRTPGEKGRVWADAREIDRWLSRLHSNSNEEEQEGQPAQPHELAGVEKEAIMEPPGKKRRAKRLLLLLLILLFVATLTFYTLNQYAGSSPQAFSIDHHDLPVKNRAGDVLWKTAFNADLEVEKIELSESLKRLHQDLFRRKEPGFPLREVEIETMKEDDEGDRSPALHACFRSEPLTVRAADRPARSSGSSNFSGRRYATGESPRRVAREASRA